VFSGGLLVANPQSRILFGGALEETDGIWLGGSLGVAYGRLAFVASAARGELTPSTTGTAVERDVGEIALLGRLAVLRWLDAEAEYVARAFSAAVGRQRWDILGIGARARHRLGGTGVVAFYRAAYLPIVDADGLNSPNLSVAGTVGLRAPLPAVPLEVVASYHIERFDFPENDGSRTDQFQYFQISLIMVVGRSGGDR
jgi:hypothetical protein